MKAITLTSHITYVNTQFETIITKFSTYDTQTESTIELFYKSYKVNTYNIGEVDLIFSSLIGAAPALFDTSVELAAASGNDQTYATTMQNKVSNERTKINTYYKLVYMFLLNILQSGINTCVLINTVDMNCKFKINATTYTMFKLHKKFDIL